MVSKPSVIASLAGALLTLAVPAQALGGAQTAITDASKVGVLDQPCGAVEPLPAEVLAFVAESMKAKAAKLPPPKPSPEGQARYDAWRARQLQQDFSQRCRYRAANAALPAATDHRVVLFGDSITELWGTIDPGFFHGDVLNRGISGQTTLQMLARFRSDVIDLRPRVVHIIAGTNDIAGNTGPTTLDWIEGNIKSMVELAKAHRIRVIIGSVPPAAKFEWRTGIEPVAAIRELNRRLRAYAREQKIEYVDYYAPLADAQFAFRATLADDGVHPNAAGYAVMRPLAEAALARTLLGGDGH